MIEWNKLENLVIKDRYQVLQGLGEGGAGKVYLAFDKIKNRKVAIKTSNPNQTMSNYETRFYMEAKILSKLSHPNIIKFYEYILVDNVNMIIMEYVEGTSLKSKLDKHDYISRDQALKYVKQILSALNVIHSHQVYHRDIKTDNIHITIDGDVKLLDFGIVQIAEDQNLTRQGSVIGTISYLAPEIILDPFKKANERTDIYSLGILFYQLLTKIKPFKENGTIANVAERNNDLARKIAFEPVLGPREIDGKISKEIDHLVMKMIEKDPNDRYQTTLEVLNDLHSLNSGGSINQLKGYYKEETEEHTMKKKIVILTIVTSIILLILIVITILIMIY